jgi:3-oxoadipate enol-lactonase
MLISGCGAARLRPKSLVGTSDMSVIVIRNCKPTNLKKGDDIIILKTSDGIELFYEIYGEKRNTPIVLVHGLGAEHNMWLPQILKYPSQGLFVIAPDMRGHGRSSKVKSFKISDCARDINELLEHLGIAKANLVGVSMGGLIAQQFACDFPEKVEKLVIVDSFSDVRTFTEKFAGWIQWLAIKVAPGLLSKSLGSAYKGPDKAQALRYFKEAYSRIDKKQLLSARAEVNRFDIIDRLGEIKASTLVLVGDGFGDFAINMAKRTANAIRDSQFKILKGGCDPSNLVVPDVFDDEVLDFIKTTEEKQ